MAGVKEYAPTGATQPTKLTDCNGLHPKGKLTKCKFDHEKDWLRYWTKASAKDYIESLPGRTTTLNVFTTASSAGFAEIVLEAIDSLPTTVLP